MIENKKYEGVIFDFNGTLFWDTHLHNIAWNQFLKKHNLSFSDDEFFRMIHGKNNHELLQDMFNNSLSEETVYEYSMEKERMYYQLCIDKNYLDLAPGVVDFFNFLKEKNIPYTIATASGIENIDFYFEYLGIGKWFDRERIVYNNGKIKGKPNPEVFELAMKEINCEPSDVIVFEDATAGLQAARNAKAGRIIVVNSNNDDYSDWEDCQMITNFDQVDRNLF